MVESLKKGDKVVTSGGITGTISRIVDNSNDGCGGLARKCFYLGELFPVFNEITLSMISNGFQPIGQLNMSNEFAYMTFHRQPSPLATTGSTSSLPAYTKDKTGLGGGFRKITKRSKKRSTMKSKKNRKFNH